MELTLHSFFIISTENTALSSETLQLYHREHKAIKLSVNGGNCAFLVLCHF